MPISSSHIAALVLILHAASTQIDGNYASASEAHLAHPEVTEVKSTAKESCKAKTNVIPYQPTKKLKLEDLELADIPSRCNETGHLGDHFLVTTTYSTDTSWMEEHISLPYFVYKAHGGNQTRGRHHHPNHGFEAMGYIYFIAEYYDCLPKITLFAHPHRMSSWHSINNMDYELERVQWDLIPGYIPLHRYQRWAVVHVADSNGNLYGREIDDLPEGTSNEDCPQMMNGTTYNPEGLLQFGRGEWLKKAWEHFFEPAGVGKIPEKIRCSVTGEFFVTRERIQRHPRDFYLRMVQWMLSSDEQDIGSYALGAVFEYTYHIIFGEQSFMTAPPLKTCELYRCSPEEVIASSNHKGDYELK